MDNTLAMYKNILFLYSSGKTFRFIFDALGIPHIYVYGLGEFGRYVIGALKDEDIVVGASDRKIEVSGEYLDGNIGDIIVYRPDEIPQNDIPIIVAIASDFCVIREQLKDIGIDEKRVISLNSILYRARYLIEDTFLDIHKGGFKEFLIVGSNFDNKGSQAMAFITMNEIRRKYENAIIWFCPNFWDDIYVQNKYRMIVLKDGYGRDSITNEIYPQLTAVFDVSGYALFSPGRSGTDRMISFMSMAYDYSIPYYLMPQSFGPFEYLPYKKVEIVELLKNCKIIFAREKSGFKLLSENLELSNIVLINDMVLTSKAIDRLNVYIKNTKPELKNNICNNTVGVVPNTNLSRVLGEKRVISIYKKIIDMVLINNKKVIIIPHSNDKKICDMIYKGYDIDDRVSYYKQTFDCSDFELIIKNLDFIVASRYHAIVHAYRQNIPCIVIGWADKYNELIATMKQDNYFIDGRDNDFTDKFVEKCVLSMLKNFVEEKKIIKKCLENLQKSDCFNRIWSQLE